MNVEETLGFEIADADRSYTERDTILYALGVNLGLDPSDEGDLKFLFEQDLTALPGFSNVLAHPGFWLQDPKLDIDWVKVLHAEQFVTMSRPLAASGTVRASYRVMGITDKGDGRGAILYYEKTLRDVDSNDEICRVVTGVFCRGDGGCGDHGEVPDPLTSVPDGEADIVVRSVVDKRAALIYRLSGDYNPIHISPAIAAKAGYDRPILHGLCTMGVAGHVLLQEMAGGDPAKFGGYACRFSRPVFPGDTLRTEIWNRDGGASFRVIAEDRDEVVLDRGSASLMGN
ncbi:MAG: 3-alpha,7-alpha,12-alpha-trihydroxy-5-beta-cholest-24-enoyl-CoA hydratase [Alphaproteobacteria bacterium]|jgi:acyl dehydratase|nr:3-alpha,7-alpha,12-alpha-trihydroxy-5-beta-cholest-24-enoyl-CoA hydratase [Alphaproteobacteria bacterium]MBT4019082.1 3-alpha,7-alpha,12-alpha-trihydroxy-5-beta-cholest-24-enoyl-CoA hydratase [Alphaproteobacteria bacterium]MBT4966465.1 3-alpha,7-alpha,12-alpha-trihydroxy-5-beta-cholest-24-enoyl-CoA hydratase [Alphaproteobacteria bacterium]MBT5160444.1 3-alpha,7-alpha,12-alpha-trihydroxy-5-beta-cholest-24-enoyl-CoA hydratase [Alphaproteobacteria bacterium]MBT5917813.1 3-alpha,7-alpha,12-alpha